MSLFKKKLDRVSSEVNYDVCMRASILFPVHISDTYTISQFFVRPSVLWLTCLSSHPHSFPIHLSPSFFSSVSRPFFLPLLTIHLFVPCLSHLLILLFLNLNLNLSLHHRS